MSKEKRLMVLDGCVLCGITIHSALTNAHAHPQDVEGRTDRLFRLCWTCHRLYDHDIVKTHEVIEAETLWQKGEKPDATSWFRRIESDLAAQIRKVNKAFQHKGAAKRAGRTKRLSTRAKRAWKTRRAKADN